MIPLDLHSLMSPGTVFRCERTDGHRLNPCNFRNSPNVASTTRQTFAFARDRGLRFSNWVSAAYLTQEIPVNAMALSCLICILLVMINIGSPITFYAIISLNMAARMLSYAASMSSVI